MLETPHGGVRAREVVLALNAWGTAGRSAAGMTNFGSYVVLTEPVPELLEEIGWTGGEAIIDGRMFLHYFRTTPDGRVLMGSGSGPIGLGGWRRRRLPRGPAAQPGPSAGCASCSPRSRRADRRTPGAGRSTSRPTSFPFFGTVPGTRIHYGAGYSGNGVGPSWLGGQILASLALGARDEWTALPLVDRQVRRLPPEPFATSAGSSCGGAPWPRRRRLRQVGGHRCRTGGCGDPASAADADRNALIIQPRCRVPSAHG